MAGSLDPQRAIDTKEALFGKAVEFIHNATLLHDDVIDMSEKKARERYRQCAMGK